MVKLYTFLLFFLSNISAFSLCDMQDNTPPSITSFSAKAATCSSNGTLILNCTGGGGTYFYEIIAGPVTRILQSQNIFSGLPAGFYTYRVTGCNGLWKQDTFTIADRYSEMKTFIAQNVDYQNSFKCNISNNGKAVLYLGFNDTNYIRRPLCYQITTSPDPVNGFNGLPCNTITFYPPNPSQPNGLISLIGSTMYHSDTIYNLSPNNYYIRITDSCDNFLTTPLSIPLPPTYNTSRIGYRISLVNGMQGCVAQPFFRVLDTVSNIFYTTADNLPNAPFNLKIFTTSGLRLFDHTYSTSEHPSMGDGWTNQLNANESVPLNTPLIAVVTDKCGNVKTYNILPYNSPNNSIISYGNNCNDPNKISIIVKNVFVDFNKLIIFNAAGMALDTIAMSDFSYIDASTGFPKTLGIYKYSPVTIGAIYKIKVYSNCGQADSVTFTVPMPSLADQPTLASTYSYEYCTPSTYKTILKLTPIVNTGISDVFLINGPPVVGPYPIGPEVANKYTFKHLTQGTYTVLVLYGCGQSLMYDVTVPDLTGASYSYSQSYAKQIICKGEGFDMIPQFSGYLPALFCRVFQLPDELKKHVKYLLTQDSIAAANAGCTVLISGNNPSYIDTLVFMADTAQLYNGMVSYQYSHVYANPNTGTLYYGNYAASLPSLILFKESNVDYGGTYVIDYLTCLSNQPIDRDTIVIRGIIPITSGSSLGMLCGNNTSTIIMSPLGGIRPYQYAYKNLSIPNSNFSAYTTDSIFTFMSAPPGTIFRFLIIDFCGNAVTVDIPITSLDVAPVILNSGYCFRESSTIFTQFLPYANYTWSLNGHTIPFADIYSNTFVSFSPSDTGLYEVNINFAANCTTFVAQKQVSGLDCVLPLSLVEFTSILMDKQVHLFWKTANETNLNYFLVERSVSGLSWEIVDTVYAKSLTGFQLNYDYTQLDSDLPWQAATMYYRLKMVDFTNDYSYSNTTLVRFPLSENISIINKLSENVIEIYSPINNKHIQLELMDVNGSIFQAGSFDMDGYFVWSINNSLPRGIYILRLNYDESYNVMKLVKL